MPPTIVRERRSDLKQSRQEELEQTLEKIRGRHGAADGTLDVAQLPPAVQRVHSSLTAELTAIEANRVVKSMEKLYTHATTGGERSCYLRVFQRESRHSLLLCMHANNTFCRQMCLSPREDARLGATVGTENGGERSVG